MVAAVIPDGVRVMDEAHLVKEFGRVSPRILGDRWIESGASAVLAVPSAVVPLERNFLLNPLHRDFRRITVEPGIPFTFDERLFGS